MKIAGLDVSMTSPGITVYDTYAPDAFCFYALSSKNKLIGNWLHRVCIDQYPLYSSPEERFDKISEWIMEKIRYCDAVFLEGYSYGSSGSKVFEIGENTGVLKHKLYKASIPITVYAPTSIKKHACGNGRADKIMMYDVFYEQTKIDLLGILGQAKKDSNPISDIVDSYHICQLGKESLAL